jgi:branched-chain amino acid transport system substrate-binding protein
MKFQSIALAAAIAAAGLSSAMLPAPARAQAAGEQFIPLLVYRTGQFAPLGIPWADGKQDYLKLVNARDGGVNGVKLAYEECETAYDAAKGVECYDRLKAKGTGASGFDPQSTGITFAVTDKAFNDKVSIETMGYGLSQSVDGTVFEWNFPLLGTYWTATDVILQDIAKKEKGSLKGKKIALVYHDSPYGKEPIPVLQALAKQHGFDLELLPVTHPGVEQKATWLQIRQSKPDFVLLWGWGVMNSTAIKEAAAVAYPREKMLGVWWAGAEADTVPAEDAAKGYKALALNPSGTNFPVHADIFKYLYDKGQGVTDKKDVGNVLYNRGMINAMFATEAVRTAQDKFGKKPLTGEQVRWGLENLDLTGDKLTKLGFAGLIKPLKVTCANHTGIATARVFQWDGKAWNFVSDWIDADQKLVRPMIEAAAKKYATEKNLPSDSCKVS